MYRVTLFLLGLLSLCFSTLTSAQTYIVLGAAYGLSSAAADSAEQSNSGFGLTPGIGYAFTKRVAVEANALLLDQLLAKNATVEAKKIARHDSSSYEADGLRLAVVGNWPLAAHWRLIGTAGVYYLSGSSRSASTTYLKSSGALLASSAEETGGSGFSAALGAGIEYQFDKRARLRLAYEAVDLDDSIFGASGGPSRVGLGTLSVIIPFSGK